MFPKTLLLHEVLLGGCFFISRSCLFVSSLTMISSPLLNPSYILTYIFIPIYSRILMFSGEVFIKIYLCFLLLIMSSYSFADEIIRIKVSSISEPETQDFVCKNVENGLSCIKVSTFIEKKEIDSSFEKQVQEWMSVSDKEFSDRIGNFNKNVCHNFGLTDQTISNYNDFKKNVTDKTKHLVIDKEMERVKDFCKCGLSSLIFGSIKKCQIEKWLLWIHKEYSQNVCEVRSIANNVFFKRTGANSYSNVSDFVCGVKSLVLKKDGESGWSYTESAVVDFNKKKDLLCNTYPSYMNIYTSQISGDVAIKGCDVIKTEFLNFVEP